MAAEEGEPWRAVAADPEPEAPARRLSRAGQGSQEGYRQGQNQPFPVFRIRVYLIRIWIRIKTEKNLQQKNIFYYQKLQFKALKKIKKIYIKTLIYLFLGL